MNATADALPLLHDAIGAGPTLVLLPGAQTGWASWEAHARALAPTRRVVRLQLLCVELAAAGHRLPATYSTATELDALEAALIRLGDEPVDVVGWSYGAALAVAHALRHPQSVRTLTIVEPAWPVWLRDRQARPAIDAMVADEDGPEDVRPLDVPTLLVRGSNGSECPAAITDVLAASVPCVRQLELPGGHACHLEQGPRFLEALAAHLDGVPAR